MTLIIALKCADGVVLGADGAATLGSMGELTATQPVKKLRIVERQVVVGVSGPVGLAQRIEGEIREAWRKKALSPKKPNATLPSHRAMCILIDLIRKQIQPEFAMAKQVIPIIGQAAQRDALSSTIVALPLAHQACLFEFDQQGAGEEKTDDLPFCSIGSAQKTADPFLAFLRRVFWPNELPSVAEGVFSVFWALDYSIQGEPAFVSEPKQVITLKREGNRWEATEVSGQHLQEHAEAVAAAEKSLVGFRGSFRQDSVSEVPAPSQT